MIDRRKFLSGVAAAGVVGPSIAVAPSNVAVPSGTFDAAYEILRTRFCVVGPQIAWRETVREFYYPPCDDQALAWLAEPNLLLMGLPRTEVAQ